jgi:hypothetical protein
MLKDAYLVHGLDALSRAHETDYFGDGHRGAAIIAAYYLCREVEMARGADDIIREMIDAQWTHSPLCAPFPDETPEPELVGKIAQTLQENMDGLRQAGHNVIFPTLALKAFRQLPEAVTPARVDGICRLIEAFTTAEDIRLEENDNIPGLGNSPEAAELILSELLRTIEAFGGRGQGWSGHLLTYGRALLDLRQLGYETLARKGEHAFKIYIKRIRMGPLATDRPRPEHPPSELLPHQLSYWENRKAQPIRLGHVFKYPYGFYGLMDLAKDAHLKRQCMQVAYHIL